jgi:hypothetical protein
VYGKRGRTHHGEARLHEEDEVGGEEHEGRVHGRANLIRGDQAAAVEVATAVGAEDAG